MIIGSFLLIYQSFFLPEGPINVLPGTFSEMIDVPLDLYDLGLDFLPLQVENYLLFQNFEILLPQFQSTSALIFSWVWLLLLSLCLPLISSFKRYYFIGSMALVIVLLTLSGVNGFNIGGIGSNSALLLLLIGFCLPSMIIHVFYDHFPLLKRAILLIPISLGTVFLLFQWSTIDQADLYWAENSAYVPLAVTALFMLYNGHSILGAFYILLSKLNQGIRLKISWHITVFAVIYLTLLTFILLDLTGDFTLPFDLPSFSWLMLIAGATGYVQLSKKLEHQQEPLAPKPVLIALYWICFAISAFTFWKAESSANKPMADFLGHWLIYTQLSLTILFFMYLLANFAGFMNSGKDVAAVLFKPNFFAYIHMRIGALIALLSIVVYADGILAPQLSASSTQWSADYYYNQGKDLQARILYENAWIQYRNNPKASTATSLLYLEEKQLSMASKFIEEALEWDPSEEEIILASHLAHKRGRFFDAVFYYEKGLEIYPNSSRLSNNLALLYSKGNQGQKAIQLLEAMKTSNSVLISNLLGLKIKHLSGLQEPIDLPQTRSPQWTINNLARLNYLALTPDTIQAQPMDSRLLQAAYIRNSLTSGKIKDSKNTNSHLDSLIANSSNTQEQMELRLSKVVNYYQQHDLISALKQLNGLMLDYPKSSGYFRQQAAAILASAWDFHKASTELTEAGQSGFSNYNPVHLMILAFGQNQMEAERIASKHQVKFPEWMSENNPEYTSDSSFYAHILQLSSSLPAQFWPYFTEMEPSGLKVLLASQVLFQKSHWLLPSQKEELVHYLKVQEGADQSFISAVASLSLKNAPAIAADSKLSAFLTDKDHRVGNPYFTPLVLAQAAGQQDLAQRYEILRAASEFNLDPLLWTSMILTAKKLGISDYALQLEARLSQSLSPQEYGELQVHEELEPFR